MTRRLHILLAVLAALAALVLLDRPAEPEAAAVDVADSVARTPRKVAQQAPPPLPATPPDAPIPDLFGGAAADVQAPAAPADAAAAPVPQRPTRPFTLLGFREEGRVREAYLLQDGGEVATVRAGDVVNGRYRVLALGGDSVDIKDKQSGTAIRIGFEDHQ